MAFDISGALRGASEYMTGSRELDEQRQLQAHRKQLMDKEAFDLEQSRAGAAQQIQMNQMGGKALGQMYPPPQTPQPGQASVPSQPQVPGGMQQQAPMGGPPQPPGAPPQMGGGQPQPQPQGIPAYQTPGGSSGASGGIPLPPGNSKEDWNKISASYDLGKPQAASERMKILQQELQSETDPANRAALLREIAKTSGQKMPPPDAGGRAQPQGPGQAGQQMTPEQGVQVVAQKKVRDIMGETIEGFRKANVPQEQWLPLLASLKGPIAMQFEQQLNEIKTQQDAQKAAKDAHDAVIKDAREARLDKHGADTLKLGQDTLAEHKRENLEKDAIATGKAAAAKDKITAAKEKMAGLKGDMSKTGEEYMATLEPGFAGLVKGVGERGQKISEMGRSSAERLALSEAVNHMYPNYSSVGNAANAGALNANTKSIATMRPFNEMLETNIDTLKDLGRKVVSSNSALANKSINWIKQNLGDNPDAREYIAQMHFVQTEGAKLIKAGGTIGNMMTVQDKKEMNDIIDGNTPIEAAERVLDRMKSDGNQRVDKLIKENDRLRGKFGDKEAEARGNAPNTGSQANLKPASGAYSDADKEARYQAWKKQNAGK